ncbi:MAG: sulfide-dependent adenosine diphosphate thiazole synthase [Candidatus Krumholzibacteria bacterium]|nr:sulfide-dependent adenosine diphosphate thiazole synthase [Candidatus Krumholzibacteria bacterium]
MQLSERTITEAIIKTYTEKLLDSTSCDVVIVGGGPAGLVAASDLAGGGWKTALFERKMSIGGGMWGGGMMMNEIVVQEQGKEILDEFGVGTVPFTDGYYTADSIEAVCSLGARAVRSGARIFNLVSVEDIILKENAAQGVVINWTAVQMAGLHVDPLTIDSRYIIDATGHPSEVVRVIEAKVDIRLMTPSGGVEGERSLWADRAEQTTLDNTREVFPNVFVAGMCANAAFGSYRMGPIFGGMLLSGRKAAKMIADRLRSPKEDDRQQP